MINCGFPLHPSNFPVLSFASLKLPLTFFLFVYTNLLFVSSLSILFVYCNCASNHKYELSVFYDDNLSRSLLLSSIRIIF